MSAGTLISVEEYLRTSYSPDMEYVDGELVETHVGEKHHCQVQSNIVFVLRTKYRSIRVYPELRSRVTATRFRLPDVCVTLQPPPGKVLEQAPFIAIEILSEEDRVSRWMEKLEEYSKLGTRHIWVFDPRLRKMFTYRDNALREIEEDVIATDDPRIELTRDEIFQDLD
jgi:Uma2 family endonuclease